MKAGRGMISEHCHATEGLSGPAEAASLRMPGSITERAPSGRLFRAITTLSDMPEQEASAGDAGHPATVARRARR